MGGGGGVRVEGGRGEGKEGCKKGVTESRREGEK